MRRPVFTYIKDNLLGIAIAFAVTAFACDVIFQATHGMQVTMVFGGIVYIVAIYERERDKRQKLKANTITQEQKDRAFVKEWEVTRETGMVRYIFLEDALTSGLVLLAPVLLLTSLQTAFESIKNFLIVISIYFFSSYVAGVAIFFTRWIINERRFMRHSDSQKKHIY